MQDGMVYVAARETGVWILDARDPVRPRLVSRVDTVELATGIDVCHPVLFCGQRDFGVECIDVSDPARPAHIRMLKTSESQSVVYCDGVLYSGDWHSGELTVIDARDMRTAQVVRVEKLQGHGDGVDADAHFAYVSTGHHGHDPSRSKEENFGRGHGLEIFDIADDPLRPRFVSRVQFPRFYSLGKDYWTPVACGRTVFCADTYNGLFAVDASDPLKPLTIGRITARTSRPWKDYDGNEISLSPVKDLAPGEGVVYFAVPRGGLYLTATDRAFPRVPRRAVAPKHADYRVDYPHESAHFDVWRPDSRVQVRGVAAWRDVLYVACSDLGLVLLRRDSAGALVEAGRLGGRYVGDVKVVDGRLYAAEGTAGVAVYDLADPVKPREIARLRDFGEAVNFAAWVWAPLPGWIVVSNRESGCVYLRVGADGQMKRVLRCDGCPGWDRYVADRAIGGRWIAQSTANTGFAWIDVADDPPRVIRSRVNRGAIMAGNCAFRGDRLLRFPYEGGIQYLRPGQAENADGSRWAADAPLKNGRTNVCGQPAWDGANLLALTTRNIRAVTLVDVTDESCPKVLWSETTSGHPEAPCWWQGQIVVPCGFQGLLVSTKRAEKPYDVAKPWAYWWWLNGNVSEESIARDLDELASAGFGGVVHVDPRGYWDDADHTVLPKSAMPVGGGRWTDLVAFSIRECAKRRLGFVCLDSSDAGELKDAASRRVDVRDPAAVRRHLDTWLGSLIERVGDLVGTTWVGVTTASWEGNVAGWNPAEAGRIAEGFYGVERAWLGARGLELWGQLGGPWNRREPFFAAADQLKFYSFADVPEGEFWSKWFGDNHGGSYHVRGVVSAAHVYGRRIAQTEAFTHMTRHWSKDPGQLKRSAVEAFADGVNRLVFHQWTCRDESWGLPGNEYFAGTHFNGATTWSAHLKDFVAFVTRCQRLLQLGEPVVDIAIYAGPHPYQGGIGQGRLRYDPFGDGRVTVPRGYAYDVVNDDFLAGRAKGCGYACVVRAEGTNRVDVAKAAKLPLPDCEGDVTFAHRRTADSDIYFVAGEGPQTLTFRVKGRHAALYDPVSGDLRPLRTRETSDGRTRVAVELPARDGCAFVIFRDPVEVKGPWQVTFRPATGRPPFVRTFAALADWNESDDPEVRFFAGTATYRATVTVPSGGRIAALAFGELGSGLATVRVNGVAAQGGRAVWCAPWRADCRGLFRDGENTIEIDVTNNWMNRLIGDAALSPEKRTTKSNLRLEPDGAGAFNDFSGYRAGDRLQPCGLRGPVELLAGGVETR